MVLHADDVGFGEREGDVEVDERAQDGIPGVGTVGEGCRLRTAAGVVDDTPVTGGRRRIVVRNVCRRARVAGMVGRVRVACVDVWRRCGGGCRACTAAGVVDDTPVTGGRRRIVVRNVRRCARGHRVTAVQQSLADVDEDRAEQRLLARDVPVHGGTAHARRFADVAEGDAVETALGEQARRGGQQRRPAVGLRAVARGAGRGRRRRATRLPGNGRGLLCRSCHRHPLGLAWHLS